MRETEGELKETKGEHATTVKECVGYKAGDGTTIKSRVRQRDWVENGEKV